MSGREPLTVRELLEREDPYDAAVVRHGFVDYMRDYEVLVGGRWPPYTDLHRYLFVGCVEAVYRSGIRPDALATSLPDANVYAGPDHPDSEEPDGFIWGVRWSCMEPGLQYVADGERSREWSELVGRRMHEVTIETNAFHLRLVFAEFRYAPLGTEDPDSAKDYPIEPTPENTASL